MFQPNVGDRAVIGGKLDWFKTGTPFHERDHLNGVVVRIVRETPKLWVDDRGNAWHKVDNSGRGKVSGLLLTSMDSLLEADWSELAAYIRKEFDMFRYRRDPGYRARAEELRDRCQAFLVRAEEILREEGEPTVAQTTVPGLDSGVHAA